MKNAVSKALWDLLRANAPLVAAIGGTAGNGYKLYHVIARQKITVPYITFGLLTDIPMGTFASPRAIDDSTWWFNVFSKTGGAKKAGTIAGLLTAVLDNASLTVVGYTALKCVFDFMGNDIYDPQTEIFQIPLRYRIWVDKL